MIGRAAVLAVVLIAVPVHAQTTKEANVVLDAAEKHIVREHYHDDQAVTLAGRAAGGWRLYAGAAIDARRIDLTMKNVRGSLQFRADWSRIAATLDRAERRKPRNR